MDTAQNASTTGMTSPKQQFLEAYEREHATTVRVVRAYPADQLDLKPSPKSKTARELIGMFIAEQMLGAKALTTGLDFSKPMSPPSPDANASLESLVEALETAHQRLAGLVARTPDADLTQTVQFPVAPKTLADIPKIQFVWMLLCDQIHHRGQLSVYLRIAGGKLPSIYGPTADEPWS